MKYIIICSCLLFSTSCNQTYKFVGVSGADNEPGYYYLFKRTHFPKFYKYYYCEELCPCVETNDTLQIINGYIKKYRH